MGVCVAESTPLQPTSPGLLRPKPMQICWPPLPSLVLQPWGLPCLPSCPAAEPAPTVLLLRLPASRSLLLRLPTIGGYQPPDPAAAGPRSSGTGARPGSLVRQPHDGDGAWRP
ncbi:hypothetical protein PVAP13_4NG015253 [Panicum virgatum]|uniref:Uncharacterized protein n=1 Tax=Panicum virgatum TaxID=38727 RepID=A0A8T0T6Q8_PANVG|nr:hypothetical protein PVAP13_4NG015253 [Panicum virgatum]